MKPILKKKNDKWGKSQLGTPRVHRSKAPSVPPKEPVLATDWAQMVDTSTKQHLARTINRQTNKSFVYWNNKPSLIVDKVVKVVLGTSSDVTGKTI